MAEDMDTSVEPTELEGAPSEGVAAGSKRKRAQEVRDPNAPKRPSTAYIFFSTEMRPKIREDYPELSLSERSKLMGRLWANLEQTKKQPYFDMAEQDKERYIRDYVAYQETDSYKEFMRRKYPGLSKRPRQEKPEEPEDPPPTQSTRVYTGKRPLSCQQQYVPGSNIPIFSEKFLEHNREMEVQLRKLRQSNSSLEEECALLSRHVENMKTAVEKIQNEVVKQQSKNDSLKDNLGSLREVLASTFKDIAIPDTNETPTVDNIDSYMGKLQVAIASEPDKHPELVDKVTEIAKQLELYLLQRFTPSQDGGGAALNLLPVEVAPPTAVAAQATPTTTEATPTGSRDALTPVEQVAEATPTESRDVADMAQPTDTQTTPTTDTVVEATAKQITTDASSTHAEATPPDHTPPIAHETTPTPVSPTPPLESTTPDKPASEQPTEQPVGNEEEEAKNDDEAKTDNVVSTSSQGDSGGGVEGEGVRGDEENMIVDDESATRNGTC